MRKTLLFTVILITTFSLRAQNWYQIGFKISSKVPLVRSYSDIDYASSIRSLQFGGFFRAGKYVYGEVGIGYEYFKGNYIHTTPDNETMEDLVECRYLVIPIKAVGDVPINKTFSFLPYIGVLYNPLLKVTDNTLGYSKENIENHWTQFTTGFDFRLKFVTVGIDYRLSFQHFFQNKEGRLPQFIGFNVGVIF